MEQTSKNMKQQWISGNICLIKGAKVRMKGLKIGTTVMLKELSNKMTPEDILLHSNR